MRAILLQIGGRVFGIQWTQCLWLWYRYTLETFVILQSLAQTYVLSDKSDLMHGASLPQSIIILLDRNSAINATIIIASKKGIQEFYRKFVWKKRLEIPSKFHSFFANKFWCAYQRHAVEAPQPAPPKPKIFMGKKGNNSKTYLRVIFCSWNRNYPGCDLTCPHTRHRHRINNQSVDLRKPFLNFFSFIPKDTQKRKYSIWVHFLGKR